MSLVTNTGKYAYRNTAIVPAPKSGFSMFAWVQRTASSSGYALHYNNPAVATANTTWMIGIRGNVSAIVGRHADDIGGDITPTGTNSYSINTWATIAMTMGPSLTSVYINGSANKASSASTTIDFSVTSPDCFTLATAMTELPSTVSGTHPGLIAHVAVWDVQLSDAEIDSLNAGANPLAIQGSHLKAYWPLGDAGGGTPDLTDYSGNGYTLTNVTGTYSATEPTVDAPPSGSVAPVVAYYAQMLARNA